MAFFGLTILGEQNPFHSNQEPPLNIFTRDDFSSAWNVVTNGDMYVNTSELESFLRVIYHCPEGVSTPSRALSAVYSKFEKVSTLSKEEYMKGFMELQQESEQQDGSFFTSSCEYSSIEEYRASLTKHCRMVNGPREKYGAPITNAQEVGWTAPGEMPPRLPKTSCEETKFASAMYLSGM